MADNNIDVRITGNAAGAKSASADAANAFEAAFAQMREAMGSLPFAGFASGLAGMSEAAKQHSGEAAEAVKGGVEAMKSSLESLASPFELVRQHFAALGAVLAGGAAFKEAISTTRELSSEAMQLSKATGLSVRDASGLNVALKGIGSNADTYTDALAKLTRQVRTNEEGLNAMGIATRDANGQYLDGRALMDSAIETLNTYKQGTDRNLASQVAFGRGAADSATLLRLSQEVQEEGAKKAAALNLVIGPDTVAAARANREAMNDVKEVGEGMDNTLGQAVMPVFTDIAHWFAEGGPAAIATFKPIAAGIADTMRIVVDVVKDLASWFADTFKLIGQVFNEATGQSMTWGQFIENVFAVVGIALVAAKAMFQISFEIIKGVLNGAIETIRSWANVAERALHLDFAGATAAFKAGLQDTETAIKESAARIVKIKEDAAAQIQKLALGEGYGRPGATPQADTPKPDGLSFDDPNKKTDGGPVMAQYEAELAEKKLIDQELAQQDGFYYQMSKAQEQEYWQDKLAITESSSKAALQIRKKIADLGLAISKEGFDAEMANLQKQEAAIKNDYDKKIAIAQQELELIRQKFGDQGAEYQKGLEVIAKLQQQAAAQSRKLQEQLAANETARATASIDLEEQQAQFRNQLGETSNAQYLAEQKAFEDRRYAIAADGLAQRKLLMLADPDRDPTAVEKINGEIEALDVAHQKKLATLSQQTALESAKHWTDFTSSMQSSFASALTAMLTHTQSFSRTMQQLFTSIGQSFITEMVAKPLAEEAMKAVRETALYQYVTGQKIASATEATTASVLASKTEATGVIPAYTEEAAIGAAASVASIPYVGPFLAAAAFAEMEALGAGALAIASASGGYDIPGTIDPITQLHANEMVLPAKHADVIRSMADGGGGGAAGGDVHLHVHAVDADSVKRLFRDNGQHIVSAIRAQRRSFNPV